MGAANYVYCTGPDPVVSAIYNSSDVKIKIDASSIELFSNEVSKATFDRPSTAILFKGHSKNLDDGFMNVLTSFDCHNDPPIYGKLDYEMTGYYHIMNNGKINVAYNNEYDAATLKFNIFNVMDQKVQDESDFDPINVSHGENYLTIDVSDNEHCIGIGYIY